MAIVGCVLFKKRKSAAVGSVKMSKKDLRALGRKLGAIEVIYPNDAPDGDYKTIAFSRGTYGVNGVISQDRNTGKIYATYDRNSVLFKMLS